MRKWRPIEIMAMNSEKYALMAYLDDNPLMLRYASKEAKSDKQIVKSAIWRNGHAFEFADESLKRDVPFIKELLTMSDSIYFHVPKDVRESNPELFLLALKLSPFIIMIANEEQKKNPDIFRKIIGFYKLNLLKYVDESLLDDYELIDKCLERCPWIYQYLSERLKADEGFLKRSIVLFPEAMSYAPLRLRSDRDFALQCIKISPSVYEYLEEELRSDKELTLEALEGNAIMLQFASENLKSDVECVTKALENRPLAYIFTGPEYRCRKELFLEALNEDSLETCKHAPKEILKDREMAVRAIKVNPRCFQYFSDEIRSDYGIVKSLVKINHEYIKLASQKLLNDPKLMGELISEELSLRSGIELYAYAGPLVKMDLNLTLRCVSIDGGCLKYVPLSFRDNEKVVLAAIRQNGNVLRYASKRLREDAKMIEEANNHK